MTAAGPLSLRAVARPVVEFKTSRNMALHIVPETEVTGIEPVVGGNALSRAEEALARIADELGVRPLMDFFSQSPAETIDLVRYTAEVDDPDATGEAWFGAADGLKTTQALLGYLQERPAALANADAVVRDLLQFEAVLRKLAEARVRWHFALDP